jgi:4-amino-4-deoxychorismate lyase
MIMSGGSLGSARQRGDAILAPAEDREVGAVEDESLLALQAQGQGVGQVLRSVDHAAAGVADHVHVVVVGRPERRGAVAQMGMAHQPDLLEQLEGAIDRGEVDIGHGRTDLLRRRMPESADGLEHLVPLRRHAQAAGPQPGSEVGVDWHPFHRRRARAFRAVAWLSSTLCPVTVLVLGVLGIGLVDPDRAVVRADDSGIDRGDGCFEGCRIRTDASGRSGVDKLPAHLARMQRSAAALDIPFDEAAWRALIDATLDACRKPGEYALKLVLTRGAADGRPTGLLTVRPLPESVARQRRDGLRVITLDRGFSAAAFTEAPWLLGGVKTLSYAVNMAAVREAERRGADDAIFVSADGLVLEAPTASVVWALDRTLRTTPTGPTGILPGTTQQLLFDRAVAAGWAVEAVTARVDDLHAADTVWLVSSVRGPVDVIELDGKGRSRNLAVLAEVAELAGFPRAAM